MLFRSHAHPDVLRRMKRFGGTKDFLNLIDQIRKLMPHAGIRSNFIVGFPGETEDEFKEIQNFLEQAELDAIGIFGYSPEDGTEAINFENQINSEIIAQRVNELNMIAEELMSQKAQSRIGQEVDFLVENIEDQEISGRIMQQGPEVDGISTILDSRLKIGEIVKAVVTGSSGPDLEVSRK